MKHPSITLSVTQEEYDRIHKLSYMTEISIDKMIQYIVKKHLGEEAEDPVLQSSVIRHC